MRAISWMSIVAGSLLATSSWAQSSAASFKTGYRYDAARQLVGIILPLPAPGANHEATRNTYNPDGRIVKIERGYLAQWHSETVLPANWPSFAVVEVIDRTYDVMGRLSTEKRSAGPHATNPGDPTLTQFSYNSVGRLECTAVRMNPAAYGSLPPACTPGALSPQGSDRITRLLYDPAGQLVTEQRAFGTGLVQNYAAYGYTLNGRLDWAEDANGNRSDFTYDPYDRVSRLNFPNTTVGAHEANPADYEEYGYDANSNRTTLRVRSGETITYVFDALNRMTMKDFPSTTSNDVHYGYDLQGHNLYARFGSSSGLGVRNVFDAFGRLQSTTSTTSTSTLVLAYVHDNEGNRTRVTWPGGMYVEYTYDGLNRMEEVRENGATSGVGVLAKYSYGALSRRATITRGNGTVTSLGYYDGVSRLSSLTQNLASTSHDLTLSFNYNSASQVVERSLSNDAYSRVPTLQSRSYAPDGLNRYATVAGVSYGYNDGRGNLTSDSSRNFTYDLENHLLSVSGSSSMSLTYDPMGRLLTTTSGGSTTRYLYDGDRLVGEYNGSTLLRRYVHGAGVDEPLVWYEGAGLTDRRWLHSDHQGSVIASSNGTGVGTVYAYGPYGEPANDNWTGSRFRYTGQITLPAVKLYHYKARVYDPALGRFLQTDPVGYEDDFNLYAYVGNDPLNRVDPSGMRNCPAGDPNCVETPESAQQPGDPTDKSDTAQKMEEVVVTAQKERKDSDGGSIRFDDGKEHPYTVGEGGIRGARMRTVKEVKCRGGYNVQVNAVSAPAGATIAHTHPNSFGLPGSVPGPADGGAARSSSANVAFVMTSANVFTIESFSNGTFRTTVSGAPLSDAQRAALVGNMQNWENPASNATGATDQQRYCQ